MVRSNLNKDQWITIDSFSPDIHRPILYKGIGGDRNMENKIINITKLSPIDLRWHSQP